MAALPTVITHKQHVERKLDGSQVSVREAGFTA